MRFFDRLRTRLGLGAASDTARGDSRMSPPVGAVEDIDTATAVSNLETDPDEVENVRAEEPEGRRPDLGGGAPKA